MRRVLVALVLIVLVYLLPIRPVGAAPALQVNPPPPGQCASGFVGDPTLGGNFSYVLQVNTIPDACEIIVGMGDTPVTFKGLILESYVVPDQSKSCATAYLTGVPSGDLYASAPPTYTSTAYNVTWPANTRMTVRLQPDLSHDGCGNRDYSAKLTIKLYRTPGPTATAIPTAYPTTAPTQQGVTNNCNGVALNYGQSCTQLVSGFDAVYATCTTGEWGTPGYHTLAMTIDFDGQRVYSDPCRFVALGFAPVVRADKRVVTITFVATEPSITTPAVINSTIEAYNDIYTSRSHPNASGMYYQAENLTLKPQQYLSVELPSPAAAVRSYCLKTAGPGGLPMLISENSQAYVYADNCNFGPQFDRFNAANLRYLFPNQNSSHDAVQTVNVQIYATAAYVTATPTATPSATATPTVQGTATARAPITATPTISATMTPTLTPTGPTATATIALPCAISVSYVVPVSSGTLALTLTVTMRFVLADAPVQINYGAQSIAVPPGSYTWELASAQYTLYSLTAPARLYVCVGNADPTGTASATAAAGADPLADAPCVYIPSPPDDNRGVMPDVALTLPTWPALPTLVTATVVISTNTIMVMSVELATHVAQPAAAVATWSAGQFAGDGWGGGQLAAQPITAAIAGVFGWLLFFGMLGQFTWLMPPILIAALMRIIKPLLSLVRYVKQILPFQ